jgi:hypothetical protein
MFFNKRLVLFLVLALQMGAADAQYRIVRKISRIDTDIAFPLFVANKDDTTIVNKINTLLFLSELELLPSVIANDIADVVATGNEGLYGNKTDLKYEVMRNDDKVLSVRFEEAASGMTMHYWSRCYTFNTQNGRRIALTDLFTKDGYKKLKQLVHKRGLAFVSKQMRSNGDNCDSSVMYELTNCFTADDYDDFYMSNNSLYIDYSNCLSKDLMVMGLDMKMRFTTHDLAPILSNYGRAVFSKDTLLVAHYLSSVMPQLMTGQIGPYPIVLFLNAPVGNSVDGTYAYMRKGKGLYLDGSIIDNKIKLTETEKGNETATIDGTLLNSEINGVWKDKKSNKEYPFHAKIE